MAAQHQRSKRSAREALKACGVIGRDFHVRNAGECGRGLFVARAFPAGAFITPYGGKLYTVTTLPPGAPKSHMLRVPGTHQVIDGRALADDLGYLAPFRYWLPKTPAHRLSGYASLSNAVDTPAQANAQMEYLDDDTAEAPGGGALSREARALRPKIAFLVAKRDLLPGEEVRHFYKWKK